MLRHFIEIEDRVRLLSLVVLPGSLDGYHWRMVLFTRFVLFTRMVQCNIRSNTLDFSLLTFSYGPFVPTFLVQAITTVEGRLAARGMLRAVNLSTILQCVVFIFGVNHALACIAIYIGRQEQEAGRSKNWLQAYLIEEQPLQFQYMSFG